MENIQKDLGTDVYFPDTILLGAPDSISFRHAVVIDDKIEAQFWYNKVTIYYLESGLYFENSILSGPAFGFTMKLESNGFRILDSKGVESIYKK